MHNDGVAGDGVYGCKISNCSNSMDYYFYADNDSAGVFSPVRAAYEYYSYQFDLSPGDLVINEFVYDSFVWVVLGCFLVVLGGFEVVLSDFGSKNFRIFQN